MRNPLCYLILIRVNLQQEEGLSGFQIEDEKDVQTFKDAVEADLASTLSAIRREIINEVFDLEDEIEVALISSPQQS